MKKAKSDNFRTVLTIVTGFAVIYLLTRRNWALSVAVITGLAGVFSAWLAEKISAGWDLLAKVLGLIIPNILLSLVFYLVLFPVALLSRLFGQKDPLKLKRRQGSLFKNRTTGFDKTSFERPW